MDLFWRHGYEGVSIADLTRAMGIAPPSLYAAFGSKAALFREVLDLYQRRPAAGAIQTFQQDGPIGQAVATLLRDTIKAVADPNFPTGCMITAGLLHCGAEHAELADAIAELRATRRRRIAARLQRAIDEGELPPDADATGIARYLSAVMQGISIQAHDGASVDELNAVADLALQNWARPRTKVATPA